MPTLPFARWPLMLLAITVVTLATPPSHARTLDLGSIEFPTSGTPEAQAHFIRGVGAMHSFWYEEALDAFRTSTRLQPDFLMGYWGEAMAHNHPIWEEQNLEAARAVLSRIPQTAQASKRERAYVHAVRLLYGTGSKEERDRAYATAMERLHEDYPEDLEAACFYALALLGVAEYEPRGSRTHIRAGAVALDVFRANPNHPCASHYAIHAFDDPDHAILALPAARRYAQVAPDAHHALHMPAHIFLQVGMWAEAAAANEAGWKASVDWVERERLPMGLRDYHSLHWLHYVYLQQGRYREAAEVLERKRSDMVAAGTEEDATATGYERKVGRNHDEMVAAYVVETQRWEAAASLLRGPVARDGEGSSALALFTEGYAAAMQRDPGAAQSLARLKSRRPEGVDEDGGTAGKLLAIRELVLAAAVVASGGNLEEAIAYAREAITLEESLRAPSGPPRTIKPPQELLGQLLLSAGRPEEARRSFESALVRHPKRARALLGVARAAARSGQKQEAALYYGQLLAIWKQADPDLPELEEARHYVNQAEGT